ncbi:hypothetical protein HAX54_006245, partial [Datura stramonium]|nr:hypothetical protein [Datura stramonium]
VIMHEPQVKHQRGIENGKKEGFCISPVKHRWRSAKHRSSIAHKQKTEQKCTNQRWELHFAGDHLQAYLELWNQLHHCRTRIIDGELQNAGCGADVRRISEPRVPTCRMLGAETDKAKRIDQLCFGLNKMKNYYVHLKEKWSINAKARFKVDSFKDESSDIYD